MIFLDYSIFSRGKQPFCVTKAVENKISISPLQNGKSLL